MTLAVLGRAEESTQLGDYIWTFLCGPSCSRAGYHTIGAIIRSMIDAFDALAFISIYRLLSHYLLPSHFDQIGRAEEDHVSYDQSLPVRTSRSDEP